MMWQSIVVARFPTIEIWALETLEGYLPTLVAFQKLNLQGRNKLIVLSVMSAIKFTEVPPTIGCKIPQGILC